MKTKTIINLTLSVILLTVMAIFTGCEQDELLEEEVLPQSAVDGLEQKTAVGVGELATNGTFSLINRKSGKALQVHESSTANGGNIVQWATNGSNNQRWTLTKNSEGYYSIVNVNSGKSLDVYQSGTANGSNVVQWSYWGGSNQQWDLVAVGNGYYHIVNRNSGKTLDVSGQSTSDGANVLTWDYWGGQNQQWRLSSGQASGQLSWRFTSSNIPSDARSRITAAMNAAVARYNAGANWPARTLTVEYNTGVPTADATSGGHIRFGSNASYQKERTALHEIAHTWGVGTTSRWSSLIVNGDFAGENTSALIKLYDGADAVINTGGGHFWPYGLNYDSEWSESGAQRHVQIVWAMRQDGL